MKTLDLILCMAVGYGYVLFGLSAVTWTIFHVLEFFAKEDDSGRLYRIYYRPARRRDRLLIRGRTRRIRRAAGIFRRLRRRI